MATQCFAPPETPARRQSGETFRFRPIRLKRFEIWQNSFEADLTVIGSEETLGLGAVDEFNAHRNERHMLIFGSTKKAARFETSKAFAQLFVQRHGIPCARGEVFTSPGPALSLARKFGGRCAVKADGPCLGKGVLVCRSLPEADMAIDEMLVQKKFGKAGEIIVIQELLEGTEISLHALCDGKTTRLFPTSQDHKREKDGRRG